MTRPVRLTLTDAALDALWSFTEERNKSGARIRLLVRRLLEDHAALHAALDDAGIKYETAKEKADAS